MAVNRQRAVVADVVGSTEGFYSLRPFLSGTQHPVSNRRLLPYSRHKQPSSVRLAQKPVKVRLTATFVVLQYHYKMQGKTLFSNAVIPRPDHPAVVGSSLPDDSLAGALTR